MLMLSYLLHLYDCVVMLMLVYVLMVVYYRVISEDMLYNKYGYSNVEFLWTVGPVFMILICTMPSFVFLYTMESTSMSKIYTVVSNQWYWQYGEYSNIYDSIYSNGNLTTVSQSFLSGEKSWAITSNDVMHNWSVASVESDSLSLKMDAYPGWMNYSFTDSLSDKKSIYFGFCSELCGTNHAYMPMAMVM